jgi:hypothetical protein
MFKMREDLPNRKPTRLNGYDYSRKGAYFVTICTWDRSEIFGRIPVGDGQARPRHFKKPIAFFAAA